MKKTERAKLPDGTARLPDVLRAVGASRDDFNNWLRRGVFKGLEDGPLPTAEPGVARRIGPVFALYIGFVTALTRAGLDIKWASSLGWRFSTDYRFGLKDWFFFNPHADRGDWFLEKGKGWGDMTVKEVAAALAKKNRNLGFVTQYSAVHLRGIYDRIFDLFIDPSFVLRDSERDGDD